MGILNPHTRVVDSVLTQEGRRQIASGKMRAEFYSFSDAGAIYSLSDSTVSGSDSTSNLFGFESTSMLQDQISFEADDSGKLVVKEFKDLGNGQKIKVLNGTLLSINTVNQTTTTVSGSSLAEFSGLANGLLSSSVNNFKNLYVLGSPDLFNDNRDEFLLSPTSVEFDVTNNAPIPSQENGGTRVANINHIESLFADKRLSHVPNFKFLPPVNKPKLGLTSSLPIGNYMPIGQQPVLKFNDLKLEIDRLREQGFVKRINITETSEANRMFGQMFEYTNGQITKLDVIDFGLFQMNSADLTQEEIRDREEGKSMTSKHVFFVGKVFVDDNDSHTFVNLFTVVFT